MLLASFMSRGESLRRALLPERVQWDNYIEAWQEADFGLYFENSLIIAVLQVSGTLLFSVMAAYPLARMQFRGRDVVFTGVLATLMIPEAVTIVPNFLVVTWLHRNTPFAWLNSWPALTIPFMASAFSIFLLRQFMRGLPNELWDAARIEGGRPRALSVSDRGPPVPGTALDGRHVYVYWFLERLSLAPISDQYAGLASDRSGFAAVCQ